MTALPLGRIEDIDFTPIWYVGYAKSGPNHAVRLLSEDECQYLGVTWKAFMPYGDPICIGYDNKLAVYYDRFGTHMPIVLRKTLLKEIIDG